MKCISGVHFRSGPLVPGIVMKIIIIFVSVSPTVLSLLPTKD